MVSGLVEAYAEERNLDLNGYGNAALVIYKFHLARSTDSIRQKLPPVSTRTRRLVFGNQNSFNYAELTNSLL